MLCLPCAHRAPRRNATLNFAPLNPGGERLDSSAMQILRDGLRAIGCRISAAVEIAAH
jgi:hypothetical protein